MRSIPKYILVFIAAFAVGTIAALGWLAGNAPNKTVGPVVETYPSASISGEEPISSNTVDDQEKEPKNSLDEVWIEGNGSLSYNGFQISKECVSSETEELFDCEITISKNGRVLKRFENEFARYQDWLNVGLFNFLGGDEKQLIVFHYSGGANCCYFYEIYDMKPSFRKIYGEISEDASVDVGQELLPMDLDNDGIFEFRRRVMAFHHTEAALQPAIFQYDRKTGQYKIANRKFPKYISDEYEELVKEYEKDRGQEPLSKESVKQLRMSKFASLIYSGMQEEAWKYFDENIQHEFKNVYRERTMKDLKSDSTYRAIYR